MSDCEAAVEGAHEDCCLHDVRKGESCFGSDDGPEQVCCWCGDLYVGRHDERDDHGEYAPTAAVPLEVAEEMAEALEDLRDGPFHEDGCIWDSGARMDDQMERICPCWRDAVLAPALERYRALVKR